MEAQQRAEGQAAEMPERRALPRYSVDESATFLLLSHGSCIAGRMIELSAEGCRLRTPVLFSAGIKTPVEVSFRIHGIAFRFGGVVEWTQDRHFVGVRFVAMPSRNRMELCDVLLEIEADVAAKAAAGSFRSQPLNAPRSHEDEKHRQAQAHSEKKVEPPAASAQPGTLLRGGVGPGLKPTQEVAPNVQPAPVSRPAQPLPSAKQPGRDRRAQSRLPVDTSADILLINIGCRVRGRIQDLSVGGCRIHTDEKFPVGIYTRVETEFRLQGLPFRLSGVIQAVHDKQRQVVGIRFLDMSSRKREQVEQLIQEIEEAQKPPSESIAGICEENGEDGQKLLSGADGGGSK